MRSMMLVYGPDNAAEVDVVLDRILQDSKSNVRTKRTLFEYTFDDRFRAIHDTITEQLRRPNPKYLIVSQREVDGLDLPSIYAGDIDVILTYNEDALGELRYLTGEGEWYSATVGGRWLNWLKGTKAALNDLVAPEEVPHIELDTHKSTEGHNALKLKDVDFNKMIEENLEYYLRQHGIVKTMEEKLGKPLRSFNTIVDEAGFEPDLHTDSLKDAYDVFYEQMPKELFEEERRLLTAPFQVIGYTEAEVRRFAELAAYMGSFAFINDIVYRRDKVNGYIDHVVMQTVRDKVLALHPNTGVTVVDIEH